MEKVTKDMVLHQLIKAHPDTLKVFDSYGMGCKSCGGGKIETVEWSATVHGIDLDEFLRKLNAQAALEGAKGK
ncbi:MAG: DUF1858 domain-containing protein [Nitrospinae bacterium]|nr:DUF1858 domain-containing protein [Nitrospinota bacterium]